MNNKKSKELFKSAQKILVGGVNSPVRSFGAVGGDPLFISRAEGCYLYTEDGDAFIDYVLSWGPMLFGHANPIVLKAIQKAMEHGTSFGAPCKQEIELAELIRHFFPSCEKVRMVNSGTEATMSVIRLARGFTKRKRIIKFKGCYHGHVDSLLVQAGSGGLTHGYPDSAGVLPEAVQHTILCDYNQIESVAEAFKSYPEDIAALIVEPVPGNMGVVLPQNNFLNDIQKLCQKHGTLLIFDEVMSGFRVSPGGAQAVFKIKPDLTCLGKVIGAGLPCAAFGGRAEIMDFLSPLGPVYQAGTLSGNPLAMAAGSAMLQHLKDHPELFTAAENMQKRLVQGFKQVMQKRGAQFQINSIGTMFTLFFTSNPVNSLKDVQTANKAQFARFFQGMLEKGIYLAPSQFESNFLSSAHHEKEIDQTVEAFESILESIQQVGQK
ncbi:MAG: glutamate-1-semialdehyde 2,1-aminomutase [Parachlamydiales bacterium]|jgi:glutamate-1-semialdehyde 2,1-aminomutase